MATVKLTPAMTEALEAIQADARRQGCNTGLCFGAPGTTSATLRALRDRGFIRFDNFRTVAYQSQGRFGRGWGRTHSQATYTVTLLVGGGNG